MDEIAAVPMIEKEWELDVGCLGKLRHRVFDMVGFDRLEALLKSVQLRSPESIDRRFVSLTWYIPLFMSWQIEGLRDIGRDVTDVERAQHRLIGILDDLLGIP